MNKRIVCSDCGSFAYLFNPCEKREGGKCFNCFSIHDVGFEHEITIKEWFALPEDVRTSIINNFSELTDGADATIETALEAWKLQGIK